MRASDVHENLANLSRDLIELLAEYKALNQAAARHEAAIVGVGKVGVDFEFVAE
jgi:hypothetical protein